MTTEDALRHICQVKPLRDDDGGERLRNLSIEGAQTPVNSCDAHIKPIVITVINTGMRLRAILSLQWQKNIDLKHGYILLARQRLVSAAKSLQIKRSEGFYRLLHGA
jgi:hypothetical protein